METLMHHLLLSDRLNQQQINLISRNTRQIQLRDGDYFAEPGDISSQLAFVEKGVLRYNYYNRKAENITSSLIGEGNFIAATSLASLPVIQSDYLQAITDCRLSVIGRSAMEELSGTIPGWGRIVSRVSQKAAAERRNRIIRPVENMAREQAAARYLEKFKNVGNHLNVNQMLQYMNAPVKHNGIN
jgi:CRP-like cAMP-binding protein